MIKKRTPRVRLRKQLAMGKKIDVQGAIDKAVTASRFKGKPVNAFEAEKRKNAPNQTMMPKKRKRTKGPRSKY
jgi:hypothetical protein